MQSAISKATYMHPYAGKAPEALEKFGPLAEKPARVDPQEIQKNSATWLKTWQETVLG